MKKHIITACLYTAVTAVLFGLIYPLAITAVSQLLFRSQANGELISRNGEIIGSRLIGQSFTGPDYFDSRPSAAGTGYDASSSGGSNLGPTSKALVSRVDATVKNESNGRPVPVDLVTASASGLDPDISPAAALYQVDRVAAARHLNPSNVMALVQAHITPREFSLLGEPRVNVLELNLALDRMSLGPHESR
jgi:K+-transporting ATPase ATPase C chain